LWIFFFFFFFSGFSSFFFPLFIFIFIFYFFFVFPCLAMNTEVIVFETLVLPVLLYFMLEYK